MQATAVPRAEQPLWEFGLSALAVRQWAYPGAAQSLDRALVLPWAVYRGPVVRAEGSGVGVRAVRRPRFEVDLGVAAAFGSSANETPARAGMPRLGTLAELGPRLQVNLGTLDSPLEARFELPLRAVFDLSDDFAWRGLTLEPRVRWRHRFDGGTSLSIAAGMLFGDDRYAETFYGVDPAFVRSGRPAYDARAGLIASRATVSLSHPLGRNFRVSSFVRLETVRGAANRDSPLVFDRDGATMGVVLTWTAARSDRAAAR